MHVRVDLHNDRRTRRCVVAELGAAAVGDPAPSYLATESNLRTRTRSPDGTGRRGRDAPVEELEVINVARTPARFRAFPDDTGITLEGD